MQSHVIKKTTDSSPFSNPRHGYLNAHRVLKWLVVITVVAGYFGAANYAEAQAKGLVLTPAEELKNSRPSSVPFSGNNRLPAQVDLSSKIPKPGDQGRQMNSCVGWAVAYALKSYHEHVEERIPFKDQFGNQRQDRIFSPAFVWNGVNKGLNRGVRIDHALEFMKQHGCATMSEMPYRIGDHNSKPTQQASRNAKRYGIEDFAHVDDFKDVLVLKTYLAHEKPIIIAVKTDEGFSKAWNRPGYTWNQDIGSADGFHAMTLVGYDDRRKAYRVINSWGTKWGDGGYCWITYDHFNKVTKQAWNVMDSVNSSTTTFVREPTVRRNQPQVRRDPNQQQFATKFNITNFQPNATVPGRPDLGRYFRFDGQVLIPGGVGRVAQVVVRFYENNGRDQKGKEIASRSWNYAMYNGKAACGTPRVTVPGNGINNSWYAYIPHNALVLPGRMWRQFNGRWAAPIVAEAELYIDNYGVLTSPILPIGIWLPG